MKHALVDLGYGLVDLGYALGWRAARALPAGVTASAFRTGANLLARGDGPAVRQLRANLARVLRHAGARPTDAELTELTAAGMRSYARYWREAFRLPALDPVAVHARVDPAVAGVPHLERALGRGRGVVAALTHSGNWDVAGVWLVRALAERGEPASLVTVAERLRPESLYRRFVAYRESLGFEVLPLDGGARTAATLAARLRRNRVVCLLADRELTDGGEEVSFCGEPARLPTGPARLARQTGAALLPFAGWFTPDGWGLRFHPPVEVATEPAGAAVRVVRPSGWVARPSGWVARPSGSAARAGSAVRAATQRLADVFAADLAAHPADWHMLQPIWSADRPAVPEVAR